MSQKKVSQINEKNKKLFCRLFGCKPKDELPNAVWEYDALNDPKQDVKLVFFSDTCLVCGNEFSHLYSEEKNLLNNIKFKTVQSFKPTNHKGKS